MKYLLKNKNNKKQKQLEEINNYKKNYKLV